jgi:uncharacterized protein YdcH (DUF465 family)
MTKEKLLHHYEHLQEKHRKLDKDIQHLEISGVYTDDELHSMKKNRLALKDEMESMLSKIKEFDGA